MENFVQKNLKAKNKLEDIYNMAWDDIWEYQNWGDVLSKWNLFDGGCSKCGKRVSGFNLKYYGFNVQKVRCYECQ